VIVAVAGRRVDAPDASPQRFPQENLALVSQRLRTLFRKVGATAVVGSAACGADLLAHAEAGTARIRARIVLPADPQKFRNTSVIDRPGDWGSMYDRILKDVDAAGDLIVMQGQPEGDAAYEAANLAILDDAQALGRASGQPVCAVLVWDGRSRGAGDLTEAFSVAAKQRGLEVLEVLTLKTCFVVQGFGEKTDLSTGRVLNLDASYEVIKEAVEAAGLRCIRADEIVHSGTIDKPMYDWLCHADLVIADLSTYNVNAAYELGVRYGVRPSATMIVAENQFKNPFDVGHIVTLPYEHLGKDIGRKEAIRFGDLLTQRIKILANQAAVDSPVYTFLTLHPPSDPDDGDDAGGQRAAPVQPQSPDLADEVNARDLLARARDALAGERFVEAKGWLTVIRTMRPRDAYVVQQLALATYKSNLPTPQQAMEEAAAILRELTPETTNDPETLGLWGAVHKGFWDLKLDRKDLDVAIASYERGFYLKQDYYNGINFAFLLNVRADLYRQSGESAEAITDFVLARRVRRDVIRYCQQVLAAGPVADETKYWILATMWQAAVGLEDAATATSFKNAADAAPAASWMRETTQRQLLRLEQLLANSPLKP
jgi:tetratricopeptide (TPR) repeat protein